MNNWNKNNLSFRGGHGRSLSSVGYPVTNNQAATFMISETPYSHTPLVNQHYYTSFVDITSVGDSGPGTRRHFSWRSAANNQEMIRDTEKINNQSVQGPFESAFKSAINKMKESSINRLGTVDKNVNNDHPISNKFEEIYQRNCVTLPPKKILVEYSGKRPLQKVFKCNSSIDHDKDDDSSTSVYNTDSTSVAETDRRYKSKEYNSFRNVSLDQVESKNQKKLNSSPSIHRKDIPRVKPKLSSDSNIVTPVNSSINIAPPNSKMSVVSEAYISPKISVKQQTEIPTLVQNYDEDYDGPKFEPLPSVQDIIAKVEALTNTSDNKPISKAHIYNIERTPHYKPQRSDSQKSFESCQTIQQCEKIYEPKKRMSGLYKKSNSVEFKGKPANIIPPDPKKNHPPQTLRKSADKIPFDFKKLHNAFLDQKKEIKNLKEELQERNTYILQLESEIRNYEPWR